MKDFEYDIALSFAGENREYVEEFASHLQLMDVKVFYDKFEAATLWGKNLYSHLSEIYSQKARYCVIFISEHYAKKQWTNLERESAQERAFVENIEYILPVRFDQTKLPGLKQTVGYISAIDHSPVDLANLLLKKLGKKRLVIGNQAVLKFTSNKSIDFQLLFESLSKFKNWDTVNISEKLPVKVTLPFDIIQRIDSYRTILESMEASKRIPEETINEVKKIYSEEYINKYFISRIEDLTRKLYNLYLGEIISLDEFKKIINIYCSSKIVNYIRNILAYRLVGTEDEEWLVKYYNLSSEWGPNFMSGLPYVVQSEFNLAEFIWIQVDLVDKSSYMTNEIYYKKEFYIPDMFLQNSVSVKNISSNRLKVLCCLIPQIFEYNIRYIENISLKTFIKNMDNYEFHIRGEWFFRIDNFKQVGQSWEIRKLKKDLESSNIYEELQTILKQIL